VTARTDVVAKARALVAAKVPFHHGQASPHGCDCIGVVHLIASELHVFDASERNPEIARFLGYGREPNPAVMTEALNKFMVRLALGIRDELPLGCVVWLRMDETEPRHLAIVVDRPNAPVERNIIHSLATVGRIVEHRLTPQMRARVAGVWDYPGLS
jgi:hypothetical protein